MELEAERFATVSDLVHALVRAPIEHDPEIETRLPAPGDRVGRFEVIREIGRGGHGLVLEARDLELGRRVALKSLRHGRPGAGPARVEALHSEAEAMASLHHPNIVTLYDYGTDATGPYLVLELLGGEMLSARLARGPLALDEALRIASGVARALVHSHERGVLHRDLKPGNVSLGPRGEVKVLDFGVAAFFGRVRVGGGTPGYMAPEQRDGRPEDARTDVYALGLLVAQMLTGVPPLPPERPGASTRIPSLEGQGLPRRLMSLVERALARDPERRPDAAGFLEEIENIERGPRFRCLAARAVRRLGRAAGLAFPGRAQWLAAAPLNAAASKPW
jgi:eukaryotic-like serine/threonine-protein kinase